MATRGNVRPLHKSDPDPMFAQIRYEAEEALRREPELGCFLASSILNHATLEQCRPPAGGAPVASRFSRRHHPAEFPRTQRTRPFARRGHPR